jgi:hypothetical protein
LASKVDKTMVDYRPTPKQRSTLELLQYLTIMGPQLIRGAKAGGFDGAAFGAAEAEATARDFDQTVAAISALRDEYQQLLADVTDAQLREEITMFGNRTTRGAFLVNLVLCGHAAYRTQLFVYLKACGRAELSTMDLWAGMDAPTPVS